MKVPNDRFAPNPVTGFRRVAPAFALFFLSPFVAECLLGDFSLDAFAPFLAVTPMYGGGALLIREVARRRGLGWPTMLMLALAYGLLEEGIIIQTLFNPNYLGLHLLAQGWIPSLGIGLWWTAFVLTLHTVWSISAPIALVEGLFAERRTLPWLGKLGLTISTLLFLAGAFLIRRFTMKQDPFRASSTQLVVVALLIVAIAIAAFRCRTRGKVRSGNAPSPWLAGIVAFGVSLAFMNANRFLQGWPLAAVQWGLDIIGAGLLWSWGRREDWTPRHILAITAGVLLTYAATAFTHDPVVGSKGTIAMVSHVLYAAIAIALLIAAFSRENKSSSLVDS